MENLEDGENHPAQHQYSRENIRILEVADNYDVPVDELLIGINQEETDDPTDYAGFLENANDYGDGGTNEETVMENIFDENYDEDYEFWRGKDDYKNEKELVFPTGYCDLEAKQTSKETSEKTQKGKNYFVKTDYSNGLNNNSDSFENETVEDVEVGGYQGLEGRTMDEKPSEEVTIPNADTEEKTDHKVAFHEGNVEYCRTW